LLDVIGESGTSSADALVSRLQQRLGEAAAQASDISGVTPEFESLSRERERLTRIRDAVVAARESLRAEHDAFLKQFEAVAVANGREALDTSEEKAKTEAFRYGLTSEVIERTRLRHGAGHEPVEYTERRTVYHIDSASSATTGLQAQAKILLERRQK